jgi:hypothetical protein
MRIYDINYFIENDFTKDFRLHTEQDDLEIHNTLGNDVPFEMSLCNRIYLEEQFLKHNVKSILEIGVCKPFNGTNSSYHVFKKIKSPLCFYFGVDILDKKFINDSENKIHFIQSDSSNLDLVMNTINESGIHEIDFLMIDGWHSGNQLLKDWRFTQFLSPDGVVALHDTNYHYYPKELINNINKDKFTVTSCCHMPGDWGISFIKRRFILNKKGAPIIL